MREIIAGYHCGHTHAHTHTHTFLCGPGHNAEVHERARLSLHLQSAQKVIHFALRVGTHEAKGKPRFVGESLREGGEGGRDGVPLILVYLSMLSIIIHNSSQQCMHKQIGGKLINIRSEVPIAEPRCLRTPPNIRLAHH